MFLQEPKVEFVTIDLNRCVFTDGSPSCNTCANDGGYTGGGTYCSGDMNVSTECTDAMSIALGDGTGKLRNTKSSRSEAPKSSGIMNSFTGGLFDK